MIIAIRAENGIVNSHAHTIRPVISQWTEVNRRAATVPLMAPVITWVVLTGTPNQVAPKRLIALAISAQEPSIE